MDYSLLFFSASTDGDPSHIYHTLLWSAEVADQSGFKAIWVPERHFYKFGGIYPSPAVIGAALAVSTTNIRIRAGSLILPLNNVIRAVEDWSVVDNLSDGRVDIAFGSGWNVNDFVLAPDRYKERKPIMLDEIGHFQSLWERGKVTRRNGVGIPQLVQTFPPALQSKLNGWLTAESPATFKIAGEMGLNVLTALMHQSLDELADNIESYRTARAFSGHDPDSGVVTLMQHTYLVEDETLLESEAAPSFHDYIRANLTLQVANAAGHVAGGEIVEIGEEEVADIAERSFVSHRHTTALICTPFDLPKRIKIIEETGVDEIACLVDFPRSGAEVQRTVRLLAEYIR